MARMALLRTHRQWSLLNGTLTLRPAACICASPELAAPLPGQVIVNFSNVSITAVMALAVVRFTDYLTYRQCGLRIAARNIHGLFALRIASPHEVCFGSCFNTCLRHVCCRRWARASSVCPWHAPSTIGATSFFLLP